MSNIQAFDFYSDTVRVILDPDGTEWFVAADIAKALGYRDAHNMTRRLDDDDIGTRSASTNAGARESTVISEAGVFDAIFGSQVPAAREFRRWITREVLPEIRRTGSYQPLAPQFEIPKTLASALQLAADQTLALEAAEQRLATIGPAAEAWEELADVAGTWSIREAAHALASGQDLDTGQRKLASWLRANHWITATNEPYQEHINNGRLVAKVNVWNHPEKGLQTSTTTRITVKGLETLRQRLAPTSPQLDLGR